MASPFKQLAPLIISIFLISPASAATFSFPSFSVNDRNITVVDGTIITGNTLVLTDNMVVGSVFNATGRAQYAQPVQLWSPATGSTANFTTHFTFTIQSSNTSSDSPTGGFAFFLAAPNSSIPVGSYGGWLGLFNQTVDGSPSNNLLAVEFDTFKDRWDPSNNHVGINVNSIVSKANQTWNNTSMTSGDTFDAQVSYTETNKTLRVHVNDPKVPSGSLDLAYTLDLKAILPETVIAGFSASTGSILVAQKITNWNFTSSLELEVVGSNASSSSNTWVWAVVIPISVVLVTAVLATLWLLVRRRRRRIRRRSMRGNGGDQMEFDESLGGPRRFSRKELLAATDNFSEKGKLGEGGFGGVYRGFLKDLNLQVAVKRISRGSKQGWKEYAAEVKIISQLRHRNMVQLIGWSHEGGEFLLVYEFMANGSLDSHLFKNRSSLAWENRYKIARGLASALLYLHEEWEQCVVHRDIKSSNVMLDSEFNAKLGDFGLARLVDHRLSLQTTALAGTMGYLAPECFISGKARKESDVFSFGVVVLEIATGRRAVEPKDEEPGLRLVEWVWELSGRGRILDAADSCLNKEFDGEQMDCLMRVGLWCAHPDHGQRPSMRQVIQALNFEGEIAELPDMMPVAVYALPAFSGTDEIPAFSGTVSSTASVTCTSLVVGR